VMRPTRARKGRAAIRTFIKEFPRLQRFTASPIEIEGRGDLAYVRGSYQMTFESGRRLRKFSKSGAIRRWTLARHAGHVQLGFAGAGTGCARAAINRPEKQ